MTTLLNRCCACNLGSVITRYQNVTLVRPAGDTGGVHYTASPFERLNALTHDCSGTAGGGCGTWLVGGDLNGLSAQEVQDTVNDIMACGGGVTAYDHNCYQASGTVDMRVKKLFGAQWILARKYMHGSLGYQDGSNPHILSGVVFSTGSGTWTSSYLDGSPSTFPVSPSQAYLTWSVSVTGQIVIKNVSTGVSSTYNMSGSGSSSVARYTGIQTKSGAFSHDAGGEDAGSWLTDAENYFAFVCQSFNTQVGHFLQWYNAQEGNIFVDAGGGTYQLWTGGTYSYLSETIVISVTAGGAMCSHTLWPPAGATDTTVETLAISNTSSTYTWFNSAAGDFEDETESFSATASFSDPLGAAEATADINAALNAWDMSNVNLASLRDDEYAALAPLCCYDEVGPTAPQPALNPTMDNYATGQVTDENGNAPGSHAADAGQHDGEGNAPGDDGYSGGVDYITTWAQMAWLDPNNFVWKFPNGSYVMPSGFTAGATLIAPLRTGALISHNQAGSDRHFWFNYGGQERDLQPDPFNYYEWFDSYVGNYSDPSLPAVALRWMNNEQAQYDGAAFRNGANAHPGNFPQAFILQYGFVVTAGKYIQAAQVWPAVNFNRPCGADKYLVDMPTVCCVASGDAGAGFVVKKTGNAIAPLAAGGLQNGDPLIVEGVGVFQISSITSTTADINGIAQWIVTVGSQTDALPAGYNFTEPGNTGDGSTHIGRQRFPAAAACAAPSASGSLTGVHLNWTFNQRAQSQGVTSFYANVAGCTGCSVDQFNYTNGGCATMIGILPTGAPESFASQIAFGMPTFNFDPTFGGFGQAAVMLTMPDPFWQQPFKPDCAGGAMTWNEDDGSGEADNTTDGDPPLTTAFFAHHPVVQALSVIPAGASLPGGVTLMYDPTQNQIAPPYYPNGIPIGDTSGAYAGVAADWGFAKRACANTGRFSTNYTYVAC